MERIIRTALELGFGYAPVALALFLSFRILDIADLATDGCFVLGAAVSVRMAAAGHPVLGMLLAIVKCQGSHIIEMFECPIETGCAVLTT